MRFDIADWRVKGADFNVAIGADKELALAEPARHCLGPGALFAKVPHKKRYRQLRVAGDWVRRRDDPWELMDGAAQEGERLK
jgi:hypothetical protein